MQLLEVIIIITIIITWDSRFHFQMWQNLRCVDDFLNRAFHRLGLIVGRHPGYFVIVPLLLACICFTGYQRIHYEIDPEYLFSPVNGPGKTERAVVEQYFKVNYSYHFDLSRITRPGETTSSIILLSARFPPPRAEFHAARGESNESPSYI